MFRSLLITSALILSAASLIYSHSLTRALYAEEVAKMDVWSEAMRSLTTANETTDLNLVLKVINSNHTIPVILLDEQNNANEQKTDKEQKPRSERKPNGERKQNGERKPNNRKRQNTEQKQDSELKPRRQQRRNGRKPNATNVESTPNVPAVKQTSALTKILTKPISWLKSLGKKKD